MSWALCLLGVFLILAVAAGIASVLAQPRRNTPAATRAFLVGVGVAILWVVSWWVICRSP